MNSQAWNASNFLPLASLPGESIMMKSIVAIAAAAFALGAVPAVAADMMDPWSQMLVKPMTPAETAQFKADRQAAQAKYGQMSAEEKAAVRKAAQQKRLSDLNTMERVGQENDMKRYMSY